MATAQHPPGPEPRRLPTPVSPGERDVVPAAGGPGGGPPDAGRIVDALKASADQEFHIAERLASKARQAYALAAAVFVVSQTVAFGTFGQDKLSSTDKTVVILMAIISVAFLCIATKSVLDADDVVESGDLPLKELENDLNAAYDGDPEVVGRLGSYYLGVVRSRRKANSVRLKAYKSSRGWAALSLAATAIELVIALAARTLG